MNLQSTIARLAESFASDVMAAIRGASLDELVGQAPSRVRRTTVDISQLVDQIEKLLARNPKGLRAEQIRAELGLESKSLPRPLADGIAQKRFTKKGQKRATTYFVKR